MCNATVIELEAQLAAQAGKLAAVQAATLAEVAAAIAALPERIVSEFEKRLRDASGDKGSTAAFRAGFSSKHRHRLVA